MRAYATEPARSVLCVSPSSSTLAPRGRNGDRGRHAERKTKPGAARIKVTRATVRSIHCGASDQRSITKINADLARRLDEDVTATSGNKSLSWARCYTCSSG